MAYNEHCKHCGHKEGGHDMVPKQGASESEWKLFRESFGDEPPCKNFESEISHKRGCPVFGKVDGEEAYCQDLPGGCDELMDRQELY